MVRSFNRELLDDTLEKDETCIDESKDFPEKLTRDTKIPLICPKCKTPHEKTFRIIVERSGGLCQVCTHTKWSKRYDRISLNESLKKTGAKIDRYPEKLSKNTKIDFTCKCGKKGCKNLYLILDHGGAYCPECTIESAKQKTKQTCLERYGKESHMQTKEMIEKIIGPRRHTTETWVKRAKEVHNNDPNLSYTCSNIGGENWRLVFCMKPSHGLFMASKNNHTKSENPSSCPICAMESRREAFSLGHEEYCRRLDELNSSLKPLDPYINNRRPLLHMCMICLEMRDYTPGDVLSGHYKCYYDSKANSHGNNFVGLKEKSIALYGDTVDFSLYDQRSFDFEKAGTMICKDCCHIWERTPHQHLRPPKNLAGVACPKCSKMEAGKLQRKSWEECESEFEKLKSEGFHRELELREETKRAYKESGGKASESVVPVWCVVCEDFYDTTMIRLLATKCGCSKHRFKTERFIVDSLKNELAAKYKVEHLNLKKYKDVGAMDILVSYDDNPVAFIEVDGEQHFTDDTFFSKVGRNVEDTQLSDEDKHIKAEELGIKVVRIYQPYAFGNNEAIDNLVNSLEKIRKGTMVTMGDIFIDGGANIYQAHTLYHYELHKLEFCK